ncbi:TPA: hypothetical protein DD690_02980 [Candidatus Daviesbacteria bacterium]|nr:MAG: hypothetical protein A3H18_02145 [Candidatus Daviesbacteria bacterium RIFCSPLOWO2_12_FULL_38_10]HBQ50919.1 hypothetical protein [Candidatus Daviesbacteria bacterium]HCB22349.1 hypothetical protein [Candidatus Daviesbacteria bacterium]
MIRLDGTLKTASRLGNIKRKILFQNTNGNDIARYLKQFAAKIAGANPFVGQQLAFQPAYS